MIEFSEIEKEFAELERNDEWEETFRFNYSMGDSNNTLDNAKHSSNEKYNRYRNILPYDHSRIKLKECKNTDYINANLVETSFNSNRKYILTQGPLKNTCEHFWQMVWEQNTKGIVMLNRLFEKGMPKCEMYFPNVDEDNCEMTLTFGKFKLNYVSEQPDNDYSIRVIECENLEQKEVRELYQFHFTNWPDFGEPKHTSSFLKFLGECKKRNIFDLNEYGPPIVHCSAGVGRSGTYILVDLMLEMFRINDNKTPCAPSELLDELRTYRMGLVQTHTQYKFAFKAIIDGVHQILSENNEDVVNGEDISLEIGEDIDSDENSENSDDEFYENSGSRTRRRPDTASHIKNKKKFQASKQSRNRIKNLRSLQEKNRLNSDATDISNSQSNGYETVKPNDLRLNLDFLKDDNKIIGVNEKDLDEETEKSDTGDDDDDDTPFATNRDIQTVKVNEPRKPLEQTLKEQNDKKIETNDPTENGHIYQRKVSQSNQKTNLTSPTESAQTKKLSDKEKRIAEKVKEMKKKQQNHEENKQLMKQVKPFIIGGGIILGGLLIFEICKKSLFN